MVLMSATIDLDKMSEYLGQPPQLSVEGRVHPVEVHNMVEATSDAYMENALNSVL